MNSKEIMMLMGYVAFLTENGWSIRCDEDEDEVFIIAELDDHNYFTLSNIEQVQEFIEKHVLPYADQD